MIKLGKRAFLAGLAASTTVAKLGKAAPPAAVFAPQPGAWQHYEVTTTLRLATPGTVAQAWVPLPSVSEAAWVTPLGNDWQGEGFKAQEVNENGLKLLHVVWAKGTPTPAIAVNSRFATRSRAVDWNAPGHAAPLTAAAREHYTGATQYIPVTGQIKQLSDKITQGAKGDRAQVAAIYEWTVCNTYRDGKVQGWARARRRHSGARCLRHPRRPFGFRLSQPGR